LNRIFFFDSRDEFSLNSKFEIELVKGKGKGKGKEWRRVMEGEMWQGGGCGLGGRRGWGDVGM